MHAALTARFGAEPSTPSRDSTPEDRPGGQSSRPTAAPRGPLPPGRWCAAALAVVLAAYLAALSTMPSEGFWVVDNGGKYLQMKAFIQSGGRSVDIRWPGQAVDPRFLFDPLPSVFSTVRDDRLLITFNPVFAILSSLPYRAFGWYGLLLLPLAGGMVTLLGLARLGGLLGLEERWRAAVILAAGLGTPLWFYSLVFWEHTLTTACMVWALAAAADHLSAPSRGRAVTAGVLGGVAVWFRDDTYLFLPVLLGLVGGGSPRGRRLGDLVGSGLGALGTLVPLWIVTWRYTGSPLGDHASANFAYFSLAGHLRDRVGVLVRLFLAADGGPVFILAAASPFAVAVLFSLARSPRRPRWILSLLSLGAVASFISVHHAVFLSGHGAIRHLLEANSLFVASPFVVLGLAARHAFPDRPRATMALFLATATFFLLYALAVPLEVTRGIHWGNRYLLVAYPLLALAGVGLVRHAFAAGGARPGRATLLAVALLAATSLGGQLWSVSLLGRARDFSVRLNQAVARRPERAIVTRSWWLPLQLHQVFLERPIFYCHPRELMPLLLADLARDGYRPILMADAVLLHPEPVLASLDQVDQVDDRGLDYYSVQLHVYDPR